jgi:hypothetical protein
MTTCQRKGMLYRAGDSLLSRREVYKRTGLDGPNFHERFIRNGPYQWKQTPDGLRTGLFSSEVDEIVRSLFSST